jgi:primosomal protein N' (replication factor Y)
VRAHQENIPIVLGSATPSLESLHNAYTGRYGLLRLNERAGGAAAALPAPGREKPPLDSGISGRCSKPSARPWRRPAGAGVPQPPRLRPDPAVPRLRLDVRMPALRCAHDRAPALGELRCHHCGYDERLPRQCPQCAKVDLRPVGAGTERAEERLGSVPGLPGAARRPRQHLAQGRHEQLFATIQKGQPCILVGTQMLAKGHHFPRVTLVSILDADGGLFSGDFRASERMAQLIVQVPGAPGGPKSRAR